MQPKGKWGWTIINNKGTVAGIFVRMQQSGRAVPVYKGGAGQAGHAAAAAADNEPYG